MPQNNAHEKNFDCDLIDQRLRDMAEGLTEAIDREVARRQREGLPIHVWRDGRVVDLQEEGELECPDQSSHERKKGAETHAK